MSLYSALLSNFTNRINYRKLLFSILLCFVYSNLSAQRTFQDAYNRFKQQATADYEDFRRKINQEYAEWMKQAWEWYGKVPATPIPEDDMLPPIEYDKDKEKEKPVPLPYEEVEPTPTPEPQPTPIVPIHEKEGDFQGAKFLYYGTELSVRIPENFKFSIKGKTEEAFAKAWENLSSEDFDNLIRDCLLIRIEHQLNDWAYLKMLGYLSDAICGKGTNEATMLQAFVYCQSGYKIRLGLTVNNDLHLLFQTKHIILGMDGFNMKDGLFYSLKPVDNKGLKICDISFPEEKPLSLLINHEMLLTDNPSSERILALEGTKISIKSQVNKNLIDFFNEYPTSIISDDFITRWAMYANTPMSTQTKKQIYPQLKKMIEGLSKADAAQVLLTWVQRAFVYEYDDKVWGDDRAFFAEETLYYPYCDCEDRSILFSRLVRDLLSLDVMLVYYPGHLASAVHFTDNVDGDYITLNGIKFIVCDPTYIGAPVGATMPDMDNQTAKVILLDKN